MADPLANQGSQALDLSDPQALLTRHQWEPLRPGVNIARFYRVGEDGPSAALLHYVAGASVPCHVHDDFEHILVLHGAQSDGAALHGPGTLLISAPGSRHAIHSPEGCIALAVWNRPVRFLIDPEDTARS